MKSCCRAQVRSNLFVLAARVELITVPVDLKEACTVCHPVLAISIVT